VKSIRMTAGGAACYQKRLTAEQRAI